VKVLTRTGVLVLIVSLSTVGLCYAKTTAEDYYQLAAAYSRKGQYNEAISEYTKAIELNPKFAMAYVKRAAAYHRKGQYDQAIYDFNKAIELNPEYAKAYSNRGSAYARKGQYDQAISDYGNYL